MKNHNTSSDRYMTKSTIYGMVHKQNDNIYSTLILQRSVYNNRPPSRPVSDLFIQTEFVHKNPPEELKQQFTQ